MIKLKNSKKEYISNAGKKWYNEEEILLLEELKKNIDIKTIAKNHERTKGAINSRCGHIAYRMYLKNIPMEEIIDKTKLDKMRIKQIIDRKQNNIPKIFKSNIDKINKTDKLESDDNELKNETVELKNKIIELKNEIVELKSEVIEIKNEIKKNDSSCIIS